MPLKPIWYFSKNNGTSPGLAYCIRSCADLCQRSQQNFREEHSPGVALFLVETNARMLSVGEYYQQRDHHNFWIFPNFKQKHECYIRRI